MTGRALVVGMGSIGKRHARLLRDLGLDVAAITRHGNGEKRCYTALSDALEAEHPDYIVIANETSAHRPTLLALAEADYSGTVLVEKPLFERPAAPLAHRFAGFYVGYNLRFHPVLRELARVLADEPAISVQAYAGQYLPDWRPGRDYRCTASSSRDAGGGVLRDLSHELDTMIWLFGRCQRVAALGGHFSDLAIDSDDVQALLLQFERCPVATVQLNYLDRQSGRDLVVNTRTRTIRADLLRGTLRIGAEERRFSLEADATYLAQHRAILGNTPGAQCTAAEALAVVDLIAAAETAVAQGTWVTL